VDAVLKLAGKAQGAEGLPQVLGHRRLDRRVQAGSRMPELQPMGMKGEASQPEGLAQAFVHGEVAIHIIPGQRVLT